MRIGLIILTGLAVMPAGCAARHTYRPKPAHATAQSHTIFNPEWTRIPPTEYVYPPWPAASSFSDPQEAIVYRETIIDRQGRGHFGHGQTYLRRFYSVREGEAWR